MIIKIRKNGLLFDSRDKYGINIDNLIFKEDFMNPEKEKLNIFFKGKNSSGILELEKDEVEAIVSAGVSRKDILKEIKFLNSAIEDVSFEKKKNKKSKKK